MRVLLVLFAAAAMMQPEINVLDQQTLREYIENGAPFDFILLDARGADEISNAIGNSQCKPYNVAWPDQFKDIAAKIPKDQPIIVYCRSGARAAKAAAFLDAAGYTRVYNAGGILNWTGPTLPASDIKPFSVLPEPSCRARR